MATKDDWLIKAGSLERAVEFENSVLAIGREFLPEYTLAVLDKSVEPGPEYWDWLILAMG